MKKEVGDEKQLELNCGLTVKTWMRSFLILLIIFS